ncbi:unnamed protein product [Aphanomyces euteiches]
MDAADHHGWTPLHEATRRGYADIVVELLAHGASVDAATKVQDTALRSYLTSRQHGWTPLHWASRNGFASILNQLLDAGANVELKTNDGKTAYDVGSDGMKKLLESRAQAAAKT